MATLTGSDILARSLVSQGMDTLFYIMGGPMIETEAAVIKLGARAIDTRHEQAASLMAHAYSRVTRKPGVCMGASGPGATNLVTGVANAFVDAAPMIAVGGSSPRVFYEMEAFQEIDQLAVFKPITKWATRIYDAKRIPELVATAYRQATTGKPGPVYLDLPGDVLFASGKSDLVQDGTTVIDKLFGDTASGVLNFDRGGLAQRKLVIHGHTDDVGIHVLGRSGRVSVVTLK